MIFLAACSAPVAPEPSLTPTDLSPPRVITATYPPPTPTPAASAALITRLGKGISEVLEWSPDGRQLAVGTSNGVVLFDGDTLLQTRIIGESQWVTALAFSRDSQQMAFGQLNGSVRVWDFQTNSFSRTLEGTASSVTSLSFSPDGQQLAIGRSDSTFWIWRLNDGLVQYRLRGHEDRVTAVSYGVQPLDGTPGGYILATGSRDGTVLAWNSGSGSSLALFDQHEDAVNDLTFAPLPPGVDPQNEKLATAGEDGTIRFWSPQNNLLLLTMQSFTPPETNSPEKPGVRSLAFTSDGGLMAAGDSQGFVSLWNGITGEPYRAFQVAKRSPVRQISFRPGTTFLATLGDDGSVRIWNANPAVNMENDQQEPLTILDEFSGAVNDLAVTDDGLQLASAHADGSIRIWDLNTGNQGAVLRGHNGSVTTVAFSNDGKQVVSGGRDGSIRIWDLTAIPERRDPLIQVMLGHRNVILDVSFSPDNLWIASASADGTLRFWDPSTGRLLSTPRTGQDWVHSLAFSPDGSLLAVGDARGVIQYWDVTNPNAPIQVYEPLSAHDGAVISLLFTPDGSSLISAGNDTLIHYWRPDQQKPERTLEGHSRRISGLGLNNQGTYLASTGIDGQLKVWSINNGVELLSLQEQWPIAAVAFGNLLTTEHYLIITGSSDGLLSIWQLLTPLEY